MWRFTMRELLLMTLVAGMGVAWWLEHRAHAEVASDARRLASFSADGVGCLGDSILVDLEQKYGAHRKIEIVEEDEAKLGIEIEQ